jgi:carbonic anhydrase
MSDVNVLIDRNRHFAEEFPHAGLSIRPRLSTVVLSCLDARVDPTRIFELELGDAAVMRNAGGRVTKGVLSDLAVIGFLAAGLDNASAMKPELVVVHHTDCGMSRLADPKAQNVLGERLGIQPAEVAAMAITDPSQSVKSDVERLRSAPGVPDSLRISGFVYDVADGSIAQVIESDPLGQDS